jgi:hypothetical protein
MSESVDPPPDLPAGCRLAVEEAPAVADRKLIEDALLAFNQPFLPGRSKRVGIFIRDDKGKILAGLDAVIRAGWMFVDNLWVDASLRGQGGRTSADGAGRAGSRCARLSFGMARHHVVPGARFLPQARLRNLRYTRLSVRA